MGLHIGQVIGSIGKDEAVTMEVDNKHRSETAKTILQLIYCIKLYAKY